MGVNFVVDKAQSMENAMALTQGVLTSGSEKVRNKEVGAKRDSAQSILTDIAQGKVAQSGVRILRGLVQGLAASGFVLSGTKVAKNVSHKVKDEYDLMFESEESHEDKVDLKTPRYLIKRMKGNYQQQEGGNNQDMGRGFSADAQELTKEYIETYSRLILHGSSDLQKKIKNLEQKLRSSGVSHRELLSLKTNIKNSLRAGIVAHIREEYVKRIFSPKEQSMEYVGADWGLDEALEKTSANHRLGGKDFGGYKEGLEPALREAVEDTRLEVSQFARDEMVSKLTEGILKGKDMSGDLSKLIDIANKVGFDEEAFYQHWEKHIEEQGLFAINLPANPNSMLSGGGSRKQERNPYAFSGDEEKDLLCNQLRAIYMQRGIKGNFLTVLQTAFKMKKLKNGLIKLGLTIEDFKHIERQGREVAVVRSREMLDEVLAERATLYDLSGPALKLIETRMKGILSNLERLGSPLSKEEVDLLIEKADLRMHALALEELATVQAVLKAGANPRADKKQGQLVKLVNRLREEANINIPPLNLPQVSDKI